MLQSELLDQLEQRLQELLKEVRNRFADLPQTALYHRAAPGNWNAQECFAHLNAQFDYYLPRIELALHKAKARRWALGAERESNWFGRRIIQAADPGRTPFKPRKSPKHLNPLKLLKVRENELKVFLINLEMLLRLVRQAREVDLNRPRIKTMRWNISSFVLGDLLEYLTVHAQRHVLQADHASRVTT